MSVYDIFPVKELSGNIVTFEDGADGIPMESLSAVIEPIQNLHGYANPWPAGGGKNILEPFSGTNDIGLQFAVQTDGSIKVTGTATSDGGAYMAETFSLPYNGMAVGDTITLWSDHYLYVRFLDSSSSIITSRSVTNDSVTVEVPSGTVSIRVFEALSNTNITQGTVVDDTIRVYVAKENAFTSWVPYENICPISGLTGLTVYRKGKNLLPNLRNVASNRVTLGQTQAYSTLTIPLTAGTYTLSVTHTLANVCYMYERHNGISTSLGTTTAGGGTDSYTFTVSSDTNYSFSVYRSQGVDSDAITQFWLEIGSTSTSYEPFNGNTYAVDWSTQAGTVYGGTVDVATGEVVVDRGCVNISSSWNWKKSSNYPGGFYVSIDDAGTGQKKNTPSICSHAKTATSTSQYVQGTCYCDAYINIRIMDGSDTVQDWKNYINAQSTAGTPIQICYELATPVTYQLTPQEVATLLGLNNVWATVAPITVKYHAQVQTENVRIDSLFVDGVDMQADGWFLKWRSLSAPKPKTDYVSVWGRDGDIDLTENESDGQVFYENRNLMMDMVYIGEDWVEAYSELLDKLHGKDCIVQFTSDPYWYWTGRVVASLFEHKPHSLTMNGIMFPYKLSIGKTTASATVNGATEGTATEIVLQGSRMRVSPKVTVTGESITLKWDNKTQTLSAGTYYVRGLKVGSDDVTIKVWGTGTVNFEYRKGML